MSADGQHADLGVEQALYDVKFAPPAPHPGSVSRAELVDQARRSDRPVVAITAPAGYGKSTLLAQWARTEDRAVAWVTLERLDDDPAALLSVLASALSRVDPDNPGLAVEVTGPGASVLGRAAPRLASAVAASRVPFVLMLDDLSHIETPACHDVLGIVTAAVPAGSQVVIASRHDQPHLPSLRATGDAFELGPIDLAMSSPDAVQIYRNAGVEITPEAASRVTARTEGWAAGLQLAALIARAQGGAVNEVSGDDRFVADYMYRELMTHLPDTTRRFLRRTAVLERLHGPLCDALLGSSDSQQMLQDLDAANLFLIPLDRTRRWYRYHGLFREFLLAELHRVEPSEISKLQLLAADWYEENDAKPSAVEHLLQTPQRDRTARLVAELALPTYNAGHIFTVQRWMTELGMEAMRDYPPLGVLAAWIAVMTGDTVEAQRLADFLDTAAFSEVPLDGSASFESARAMVRVTMCPAGPEQALADAELALAQEPAWSPWRDTALCVAAEAARLCGDADRARTLFVESADAARACANFEVAVLDEGHLAVLALEHAQWAEAVERTDRALREIESNQLGDYATAQIAYAAAARCALHAGDLVAAQSHFTHAMRNRPVLTFVMPTLAVRTRLQLAIVCRLMDDYGTARHLLTEIDAVLAKRPRLGCLVDEVEALRRTLHSDPARANSPLARLTAAELRLLPYLQTHLTLGEIGGRLFVSRNTVSTQVGSIYRKLGVSSRGEAVQRATDLGLLGG